MVRVLALAFVSFCLAGNAADSAIPPGHDLFGEGAIPALRIEIAPVGMRTLRGYVWDKTINGQERTNVLATVREGRQVYTNVAVHLKGGLGSFRPVDDKPALTLTFDKFAPNQRFHGLKKIYLNNSVQDPSYLSEQICREIFLSAGIPSPRVGHATIRLNQRDLGLYVLVEGWNKQFLKQHFEDAESNLFDGGYGNEVTNHLDLNVGSFPPDWSRLEALGQAAQEPDLNRRLARMGEVLDLDRFFTFVALEVMLGHWDGYSMNRNNFRVFDDRASGKLQFLPHGMDQMFGVYRSTPASSITPQLKALVSRAVVEVPEGRRRYFERMSQLMTNVFKAPLLTQHVRRMAEHVHPALANDSAALAEFDLAVDQLISRMQQRAQSVAQQLQNPKPPIQFDDSGEVKLTGWKPQRDSGSPAFSSPPAARTGSRFLEIRATGGMAYGSWRTTVLLDQGQYRFVGKVQTQGAEIGPGITRGGVTLRMSGERAATMVADATGGTVLSYDFALLALQDVELICEFRGSDGRARFDLDSLRLIRKSPGESPGPVARPGPPAP